MEEIDFDFDSTEPMTTATSSDSSAFEPLTLEKLREVITALNSSRPVLYYQTSEFIEKGFVFKIHDSEKDLHYVCFHPDEYETVLKMLSPYFLLTRFDYGDWFRDNWSKKLERI